MKTLSQEEARTLKAIVRDMSNVAKHEALVGIINHLRDYHVFNQVRLREIIDDAWKYDAVLKTQKN